jgi:hypothetical protein
MVKEAYHLEEQDASSSQEDSESGDIMPGVGDKYVQDWHAMVSKILEGFADLCKAGFMWDHFTKGNCTKTSNIRSSYPLLGATTRKQTYCVLGTSKGAPPTKFAGIVTY